MGFISKGGYELSPLSGRSGEGFQNTLVKKIAGRGGDTSGNLRRATRHPQHGGDVLQVFIRW